MPQERMPNLQGAILTGSLLEIPKLRSDRRLISLETWTVHADLRLLKKSAAEVAGSDPLSTILNVTQ